MLMLGRSKSVMIIILDITKSLQPILVILPTRESRRKKPTEKNRLV